jgi:hypothetical protein
LGFVFASDEGSASIGVVKVYPMDGGKPHELDVLSPIESTYRNDNLLHYPEAYQRLQETVRSDPELTLLDSNTHFVSGYLCCIYIIISFFIIYPKV